MPWNGTDCSEYVHSIQWNIDNLCICSLPWLKCTWADRMLEMPWNRKDCSEYVHSTQWNIRQSVQLWLTMAQVHRGGYRSRLSPRWGVAIHLITSLVS